MVDRFCTSCGGRLASPPPTVCESCGAAHWRNAKPGASGVATRDGEVLLVRRAHDPWREMWTAPGGFCDGAEHPIATVEREFFEEAGMRVRVIGFIGIWTGVYGDARDDLISVAYYHAEVTGSATGTPDPAEVAECRWFPWDDLPHALAPPDRLPAVLRAARAAAEAGQKATALPDRPAGT